ncbi:MAG: hypothetical protein JM58_05755 [Peptococcaceae bacterium BICA1-8]|nr:MAG: hypothetical protein JM58_05755 [Peptococcaceae bacterium BICA1-8]
MGTDDLFKKRKGRKLKRKENIRQMAPYRYLIVCEGKKTEPNYFEGIKQRIEIKYKDKIDVRKKIELEIEGTGRNTQDLVNYTLEIRSLSKNIYGNVWVVFDKDDFSEEQFNNAINRANENDIRVAWSNEAIELWFFLHFEYLDAAINRHQYIDKLNDYFSKYKINNGKYNKSLPEIFDILFKIGNVQKAIERSIKLRSSHCELGNITNCSKNPCTTVDELVKELFEYID